MTAILDEIVAYVQFDDRDRERLLGLRTNLEPHFPAIADRFYSALWANPGTAAMLSSPAQVERLRLTLIDWMASGLTGVFDDEFYEKRSRIGRRHVQIGLAQHYMFTAMSVVRTAYLDQIIAMYPPEVALLVARSLDKLFDVELALMLRSYQLDSEAKLVERERQIQADRIAAIQTLSAGLAHEVRNPLNAARLQLELLERRVKRTSDDPKLREPTALANQEMARLGALLDHFVHFARSPDLRRSDTDVTALARNVIDLERPVANVASCELVFDDTTGVHANVDAGKLHQILQQLIRNAIEAEARRVTIATRADDDYLYLEVTDDGAGMADAVRARVYDPFFTTKDTSVGLGMSIAHSYVAMHGGSIDIQSSPNGTTIAIALPR
ncbi:MAG: protoglobin domain-containing protein [Proteobacteria bacterium]|nr:protoglobin domain-containing protein [Pseudomonadota bacterium]